MELGDRGSFVCGMPLDSSLVDQEGQGVRSLSNIYIYIYIYISERKTSIPIYIKYLDEN